MRHDKLRIRVTHPALYRSIMTLSLMSVALAGNFWLSTPAFDPFGIPKNVIGAIFFLVGISNWFFLNVFRDLRKVRLGLAASLVFMGFWGLINTQQFFTGNTSLQLPILYIALAVLHVPLLIESPVNPMTRRDEQ